MPTRAAVEVTAMQEDNKIFGKYVCLDIVEYTKRNVTEQLIIRAELDEIVKSCVAEHTILQDENRRLYVPTGDGMCIALLDTLSTAASDPLPADLHLRLALDILKSISRRNSKTTYKQLRFEVRVGIHADEDYLITDINENRNLAGAGINKAFRIMNLADAGQILVSQEVFGDLLKEYKHPFDRYDAKVRHNVPLVVYQFMGESEGLSKDVPDAIKDQVQAARTHERIIAPTLELGLSKVYGFRDEEALRDLTEDIRGARKSVWLLGIALRDNFNIAEPEIIELLNRKIAEGVNVRILLLDGFRSPAIFRALLESDRETSRRIIEAPRRLPNDEDPYLAHRVFANFEKACNELSEGLDNKAAVRFYGHTPSCWLALVDDRKAYYQPYTFGDISTNPKAGYQMPVLKLEGRKVPFMILKDHYSKLWGTSDTDLFQTITRLKAKPETLWRTFQKRKQDEGMWLEQIHGMLHKKKAPGQDERRHTRLPCLSMRLEAVIEWEGGELTKGKVLDFSYEGAMVEVELPADSERFTSLPDHHAESARASIVRLDIEPEGGWEAFKAELERLALERAALEDAPDPAGLKPRKIRGLSRLEAVEHALEGLQHPDHIFKYIRKEPPKTQRSKPRVALQTCRAQ
jgi:hypothetical protein